MTATANSNMVVNLKKESSASVSANKAVDTILCLNVSEAVGAAGTARAVLLASRALKAALARAAADARHREDVSESPQSFFALFPLCSRLRHDCALEKRQTWKRRERRHMGPVVVQLVAFSPPKFQMIRGSQRSHKED
jgi:hypothetical protein